MPRTTERNARDAGAAMVEFALVVTMLVTLLLGIVEVGRAYSASTQLTGAVREGARAAALGGTTAQATAAVQAAAPGFTVSAVSVTGCPVGGGGNATVTATYNFTYSIPLVYSGTKTLSATGVMRCGG
jgi:Flp pilus assembly protein TadG